MSNYQTQDREDNCADCQYRRLMEDSAFWVGKGERSFWNWYRTLTADQQRIVKESMDTFRES